MNRGGRGGNGQSVKRKPNTPVGGAYKDQRRGIDSEDMDYDDEEWTEVSYNRKSPPRQQQQQPQPQPDQTAQSNAQSTQENSLYRPSFASVAALQASSSLQNRRNSTASANYNQKKTLEKMFVTPAPNGAMRDEITVEIQTMNEKPFKGTLTFKEALEGIYTKCLELDTAILHGIRFRFSRCPIIKFKLKEQINIDDLHRMEYFEFYRNYTVKGVQKYDTFGCKINGIRMSANQESTNDSDPDPNVRWLKVEWVEYAVQEKQILDWMNLYGEQASELSEDIHPNSDSDADPYGNGTYSIKMRLKKEVPQLLPMWGKRIRIYYRGVTKLCPNCFGAHARKNCKSEKVTWIQYVLRFMENNPDIPPEYYGKWWKIVNEEFGEIITEGEENVPREQNTAEQDIQAPSNRTEQNPSESQTTRSTTPKLTKDESDNLADYLGIGMSIDEAREAFQKEIQMAELRQKIRDSKRDGTRGGIGNTHRTTVGPTSSSRGKGRGGLTFN